MNMRFKIAAISLIFVTVACGKVGDLEPRTAQSVPPKAYGQSETPTAETLTTASVQARPGRSDELLRRSERRTDDPFDLPPGVDPKPADEATPKPKPDIPK
jgi:hypothetical protein